MDYRNERDALRGRVERLEQDLEQAQRELAEARRIAGEAAAEGSRAEAERLAGLEAAMPEAEALIYRLRRELAAVELMHRERQATVQDPKAVGGEAPEPSPPRAARRRWSALLALAVVPAMAGGALLAQRYRVHEREQREQEQRNLQTCQNAFACCLRNKEPGDPDCTWAVTHCDDYLSEHDCSEPRPRSRAAPVPPTAQPTPPPRTVAPEQASVRRPSLGQVRHAVWSGRVTRTTGSAPPPGSRCIVEAELQSASIGIRLTDLTVTCGGKKLYWTEGELARASGTNGIVLEQAGRTPGTFVYGLHYEEAGFSTGQSGLVAINTALGLGAVWRDTLPAFRVELSLAKSSEPVAGEPFADPPRAEGKGSTPGATRAGGD